MKGEIPSELAKNTRALCGEHAEPWLKSLPDLLDLLETKWGITVGDPFTNGEYNYVARAVGDHGDPCVIKVAPPRNDRELHSEAKYLTTADGNGAVRLLAQDLEHMALLMERAVPGKTLTLCFEDNEPAAIQPAIDLLISTARELPDELSDVIQLDDWFDGLRRHPATRFPRAYGDKALAIYADLSSQAGRIGYLHGDFHPDNIVSAGRSPFLLIDPKGMVGHIGYEIAVFLNNFHWWQEDRSDVRARLKSALSQFSEAFGITTRELREWAFAQMVLSAWWTFDEMPNLYNNEVAKADIWDV